MKQRKCFFPGLALTLISYYLIMSPSPSQADSVISVSIDVNSFNGVYGRKHLYSGRGFAHQGIQHQRIKGHTSFNPNRQKKYHRFHSDYRAHELAKSRAGSPSYHPKRPHYPPNHRPKGISLQLVAPILYSTTVSPDPRPLGRSATPPIRTAPSQQPNKSRYSQIDAWAALGHYQTANAIDGFKAQSRQNPQAAVPKVGFALATATAGEYDKAIWAMDLALQSSASDLHYFRADNTLKLVLEELRLHYQDDAFMRASLLYLLQDFQAADKAVSIALTICDNCTSVRNLQRLIHRQCL